MVADGVTTPGTSGEPNRHAEEVQGERSTECVDAVPKPRKFQGTRMPQCHHVCLVKQGVTRAGSQGRAFVECVYEGTRQGKLVMQYRDDGNSSISEYEFDEQQFEEEDYDPLSEDESGCQSLAARVLI